MEHSVQNKYLFFLPSGPILGGVEYWVFSMARCLEKICPGEVKIISLVGVLNQELDLYPEDIRHNVFEILIDERRLVERVYFDQKVSELVGWIRDGSILFPNYGSHTYALACAAKLGAKGTNVRVVAHLHGDDGHYYNLARYFSPFVSDFICVSDSIGSKLASLMPWRQGDISCRPCGFEYAQVDWSGGDRFGGSHDSLVIAFVGRIVEKPKRVSDIAKLASLLARDGRVYTFEIVGDGPDLPSLKAQFNDIKGNIKVNFHGLVPRADLNNILNKAHIFFSCSEFEGASLSLMESLNCGCIPVVSNVSGSHEIVGDRGYIFEVGDILTASQYIREMWSKSDAELRNASMDNFAESRKFTIEEYLNWFMTHFNQSKVTEISGADLYRNWDFTWNPAIFGGNNAHPLFRIYEKIKSKWYGRIVLKWVRWLGSVLSPYL